MLALDPASSGFFETGLYQLRTEGRKVGAEEMVAMYADWAACIRLTSPRETFAESKREPAC